MLQLYNYIVRLAPDQLVGFQQDVNMLQFKIVEVILISLLAQVECISQL